MGKLSVVRQSASSIDGSRQGTKLPRMPHSRSVRASFGILVAILASISVACERKAPASRSDTATRGAAEPSATVTQTTNGSAWSSAMGPALLIQGENRNEAIVLFPTDSDSSGEARLKSLANAATDIALFGRGGARMTAKLGSAPAAADAECRLWPLRAVQGESADNTWAVGFAAAQVLPLALDSVEVLSSRDSLVLAAEASRLASAVTTTTPPSFQGLRFAAHDIRRFEPAPGVQVIVAHLIRKVNQEANPQEEQTLLIAERDSGVATGQYQLAYAERTHGLEEATTTPEVIAGVRIAGRPTLIVARDGDQGVSYAFLERIGPRQWRIRWTSAVTRCG